MGCLSPEFRVVAAVAIPFAASALMLLTRRRAEAWTLAAAALTPMLAASLWPDMRAAEASSISLIGLLPGAPLAFRVDGLGLTFALLASGLWAVTSVYSIGYASTTRLEHRTRFHACFAASIGATLGIAFAANVITLLVFYEVLTVATYPLVAHKGTSEARSAGRRYLAYTLTAGLSLTVATAWTWLIAGTLEFSGGGFLQGRVTSGALAALAALYLFGCGVKAAIMPAHAWLPSAMVAPTPVSALLHAVAVVKAGVFGCLRVIGYVIGPSGLAESGVGPALAWLCAGTIVAGSLMALAQDKIKRRLAYSTIVHLSYIVLGGALLAPHGMQGAVLHMVNHGLAKITLFFCAGSIYATTHAERVSEISGLGRKMPWTFAAFAIAALGLIGLPGLCGFVSKFALARGAIEAGAYVHLAVLVGASVVTGAYLLPILATAYLGKAASEGREAPRAMLLPTLVTATLVVVFGTAWPLVGAQLEAAAEIGRESFEKTP